VVGLDEVRNISYDTVSNRVTARKTGRVMSRSSKPNRRLPLPTEGELELLHVLWARGPSTVREIHGDLERAREVGYTTVLKLLQIMHEKGLVSRDDAARAHRYAAAAPSEETERGLVRAFVRRAFGGSSARLVLRALADARPSRAELDEIRRLLDRSEPGQG
jgi:predicted transcriptional regulator